MKVSRNESDSCDVSPLDNSTDVLEPSSHQRLRNESTLFSQFLNRTPAARSSTTDGSVNHIRSNQRINPWREVNGEWLQQQNIPNSSEQFHYSESQWHDSDHMDVPLLISGTVCDFFISIFFSTFSLSFKNVDSYSFHSVIQLVN